MNADEGKGVNIKYRKMAEVICSWPLTLGVRIYLGSKTRLHCISYFRSPILS